MAENIIDKLVSDQALSDLEKLDETLGKSFEKMEELLKKTGELSVVLSKAGASWSELSVAVENHVKATQEYIGLTEQELKIRQQQEKLIRETIKTRQEEEKLEQQKIKTLNEQAKASKTKNDADNKQSREEKLLQEALSLQVKSIEDLCRQTNALIAVRKKLDLTTADGKREFQALTEEIAKNQKQLKEYDAEIGNFQRNVGNYSSAVEGLVPVWVKAGAIIGATLGAIDYALDVVGDGTQGVEDAFARLNNPGLLDQLRSATKGTVSDLELMKAAVKADNFQIPMDVLAKGFQFAQQRAKDTGESVDYLVDRIVTGIGRKSPLILDDLGVSSTQLKEKLGGVGTEAATVAQMAEAMGEVIDEEMAAIGDSTDTAAEKAGQLSAAMENLQNQTRKEAANFLAPFVDSAKDLINWIARNSSAIVALIKAFGLLTAAVYAYIVAGKIGLLLSDNLSKKKMAETAANYANINSIKTETASTHLLAAAKLALTGNIKAATIAFNAFGKAILANPFGAVLAALTAVIGLVVLFKKETQDASAVIEDLRASTENYNNGVKSLNRDIEKYEELQKKAGEETGLSEKEHKELNTIVERLTKTVPGLKAEFDEYTGSLSVNIEAVKNYSEEMKKNYALMANIRLNDAKKREQEIKADMAKQAAMVEAGITNAGFFETLITGSHIKRMSGKDNSEAAKKYTELENELHKLTAEITNTENALKGISQTEKSNQEAVGRTVKVIDEEINGLKKEQSELAVTQEAWEEYTEKIKALEKERESITGKADKKTGGSKKTENYDQKILLQTIKDEADAQKQIMDNENASYENRRAAAESYYLKQAELIMKQAEFQIENEKLTGDAVMYVNMVRDASILELERQMNKKTSDIHKQAVEKQKKESEELTEKLIDENKKKILAIEVQENEAMQNELTDANVAYAKQFAANINSEEARKGITRAYQMDRLRIIREYNQKIFEREVEFLKKSIQNTKLSADAKLDIEREITKLTNENAKDAADYEVEVTEDKIENMENLEDEYNRFMSDKRTKAVMNIWEQALDIANMYYEEQIKMIDAAEKKEKESYDAKLSNLQENLDAGLISEEKAAARKKILEEEQMQKEKQFEAQRKAMQKKQAVWQKANAIIQATINTAQAVTAAYGIPGVGIALASIIAALGAVQIGMIASQKIPEYEKGTKGHTGGPAIVGDGGRAEMVIFPSGKIWKTPAKDTLVNLPRGTEILPDFKKAFENIAAQPVTLYRTDEGMGETLVLYDDVQRNLLKNNNEKLSAIQHSLRSLDVIRQNTAYSNNRKYIDNWMKNY